MPEISPIHVLVIEDNVPDVMLIEETLREEQIPFEMTHFSDGEEAITNLQDSSTVNRRFDLIILDLNMPRVTGLQVLENFRAKGLFTGVPVLIFTSSLGPGEQEQACKLGADCYLRKPNDLEAFIGQLGKTVRELMERSRRETLTT